MADSDFGERDKPWFEGLYRDHHPAILSYARRRVDEPEDLVSGVFATAWRHRDRVPEAALPWLIRTARNHSMHAVRAASRRARLNLRANSVTSFDDGDHVDEVVNRQDAAVVVTRALALLPPGDQEVLRLSEWELLDTPTIAYVLECSEVAARVRLHRARRRLEAALTRLSPQATTESSGQLRWTQQPFSITEVKS